MIRSFFRFYYIWRKHHNRLNAIKCAWSLVWMHREIDKDIKNLGLKEYAKTLKREIKECQEKYGNTP